MHIVNIYSMYSTSDLKGVLVGVSFLTFYFTESANASGANTETNSDHSSSGPPTILVTAPSREDIYASSSNMTIADAVKERRPSSTPIVVGRKLAAKR